jgi:hypothetical protein
MQPNELADLVVLTVKNVVAPLQERLAVFEQINRDLQARITDMQGMRDRVVAIETKALLPDPVAPVITELREHVDGWRSNWATHNTVMDTVKKDQDVVGGQLKAMSDRLVILETKASLPEQNPALIALTEKVNGWQSGSWAINNSALDGVKKEQKIAFDIMKSIKDRLEVIETKAPSPPGQDGKDGMPGPQGEKGEKGDKGDPDLTLASDVNELSDSTRSLFDTCRELRDRLEKLEGRPDLELAFTKEISLVRERIGILEVRAQVPGPPGPAGRDGLNGKDGVDGFSLKDFSVELDADRTMVLSFADGTLKKSWPIRLPFMRQEGVYIDGKSYSVGDVVTWGGSQWHCNEDTTTKPGDGSKAWTLIVKRGKDGRDGKDAQTLPVVSVGRP